MGTISSLQAAISALPYSVLGKSTDELRENLVLLLRKLTEAIDFCNEDYSVICDLMPDELRVACEQDTWLFLQTLQTNERAAYFTRDWIPHGALYHYLHRNGEPAWLNPAILFESEGVKEAFRQHLVAQYWSLLTRDNQSAGLVRDPYWWFDNKAISDFRSLYNGETGPLEIEIPPEQFETASMFFHSAGKVAYALGSSGLTPTGNGIVTYSVDRDSEVLRLQLTQNVELYDRYDWRGTPIWVNRNAENGFSIRLYNYDSFGEFRAVAVNPSTAQIMILDPNTPHNSDGFVRVDFPPDSPDQGAISQALEAARGSSRPIEVGDVIKVENVFGGFDHPDPWQAVRILDWQVFNAPGFFSGHFHRLESENLAHAYAMFSNFDYTITINIPYIVDNGEHFRLAHPQTRTELLSWAQGSVEFPFLNRLTTDAVSLLRDVTAEDGRPYVTTASLFNEVYDVTYRCKH